MKETTYEALEELKKWDEIFLGFIIHHINQYLWKITEDLPENDEEMWRIFTKPPQEYYTAIKIRDAARSIGYDFRRNFLLGKHGRTNFSIMDNIQRTALLENEKEEIKGILIGWKEVRVSDECSRILLRLKTLTNLLQAAEEGKLIQGKTQCHESCPKIGAGELRNYFGRIK